MPIKLRVPKIKCMGCVNIVKDALMKIEGIEKVEADPKTKIVEIHPDTIDMAEIRRALTDAGYPPE